MAKQEPRGRPGGFGRNKPSIVDETYKIRISKRIEEFRDSEEQLLVFPPGLDNQERKYVHELCLKLGLQSKSTGTGESRYLTVKKPDSSEMKAEDGIPSLKLLPGTVAELDQYFGANPITQKESDFVWGRGNVTEMLSSALNTAAATRKREHVHKGSNAAPAATANPATAPPPVIPSRKKLPIWGHRDEIIERIRNADVTIISGETGSGKSTQVVQYIMDEFTSAKIVCTQPRRLSAIALAERVAEERGQTCGLQIGYSVRFESSLAPETRCLFCTTGVALSSLRNGLSHSGLLQGMTHLFIDEVHERDRNTDFLLIFVKELLLAQTKSDWKGPKIKIVLMSATMSVQAFLKYFGEREEITCATVAVEGSSFTVHPLFLEDVLAECKDYVRNTLRLDHSVGVSLSSLDVVGKEFDAASFFLQHQTPKKLRCPLCGMGAKSVEEFGAHAATCQGSLGVASSAKSSIQPSPTATPGAESEGMWEDVWGDSSEAPSTVASASAVAAAGSTATWEDVWGEEETPKQKDESDAPNEENDEDEDTEMDESTEDEEEEATPNSGVAFDPSTQKYRVTLILEGQAMDLGQFDTKEAAEERYLRALGKWSSAAEVEEGLGSSELEKRETDPEMQVVLDKYLRTREGEEETEADIDLIVALIEQIDHAGTDPSRFFRSHLPGDDKRAKDDDASAILVFFAGWNEITALCDALQMHPKFGNERYYLVLPLHSGIPSKDQRRVFARPPKGVRKIVCATNIAETSLTIEDVVYVVDTGLVKEKGYDSFTKTSSLLPHFVSKASARQRRGRAGRCRTGVCFHLYSKMRFEGMIEHQVPEILRTPLEEMCLHAKSIIASSKDILPANCSVADFLLKALDPPSLKSIISAVQTLQSLGGFDANENLTSLGRFLSAIPVEPRLGKMILYGAFLQCAGPAITLSVSSGFRDPFVLLVNPVLKTRAAAVRQRLSRAMPELGCSDHVAILTCFKEFMFHKTSVNPGPHGPPDPRKYCNDHFLSYQTLDSLHSMRKQVNQQLQKDYGSLFQKQSPDHFANNSQSKNSAVLSALLCAATFPNLAILRASTRKWLSAGHKRIRTHPSSSITPQYLKTLLGQDDDVNGPRMRRVKVKAGQGDKFFVFEELIRNARGSTIRVVTNVDPLVLVLFGGSMNLFGADEDSFHLQAMEVNEEEGVEPSQNQLKMAMIKLNSWAKLSCNDKVQAERLAVLRLRFEMSLMAAVERGFFTGEDKVLAFVLTKIMSAQVMGSAAMTSAALPSGGPRPIMSVQPRMGKPFAQPLKPAVTPIQPVRQQASVQPAGARPPRGKPSGEGGPPKTPGGPSAPPVKPKQHPPKTPVAAVDSTQRVSKPKPKPKPAPRNAQTETGADSTLRE